MTTQVTAQTAAELALAAARRGAEPVIDMLREPGAVPRFTYDTGSYLRQSEYLPDTWREFQWTGFLAGRLWLLADHFDDDEIRAAASTLANIVGRTLSERPPRFSAAGSDLFYAVCLGARLTGDPQLAELGLRAVRQYARNFDEHLGVFLQVAGVNRAVIDTGLNLLPFYWAYPQDPEVTEYALRHTRRLLDCGIIREDGSTYQAIEFGLETATVRKRFNMQALNDTTTWARGQSWAMHGHVNAYEATGDQQFLDVARAACRWYVDHLPEGHVPFYDFGDPAAPAIPQDSCSASIAANALLRLAELDAESATWARQAGQDIAEALFTRHMTTGGVVLHSSWGRLPEDKAGAGFSRFPQEDVMPYGNYWTVEAAWRLSHPDWTPLSLARPSS
jgi:unsaturated chondroitin disaccharide hydrolase